MTATPVLAIDGLAMDVAYRGMQRRALLRDVSLKVAEGEAVGLVGESGSGKSLTARTALGLVPPGATVRGTVRFEGMDVLSAARPRLRELRRAGIAMVFQDPRAHIDPVRTVGDHLTESMRFVGGESRAAARSRALELLEAVQFERPDRLLRRYPHELSGGMLQRVMIAGALAGSPRLLLADEPTSALDVTIQAEVMGILGRLRAERGLAVLFITHDLELAAATTDRVVVMYAGSVVETQASEAIPTRPRHPYTAALGLSRPSLDIRARRLPAIGGRPIAAFEAGAGCSFADRCRFTEDRCRSSPVALQTIGDGQVACVRANELVLGSAGVA